jgi:predicted DNA-binding transcriptional regulator AlpA
MAGFSREHDDDDDDGTVKADAATATASIPAQEPSQAPPSVPPPKSRSAPQSPPPSHAPPRQWKGRLISFAELGPLKGIWLGRVQINRLIAEGKFPKPVKYSAQRMGWYEDEIDAWIAEQAANSEVRRREASERQKQAAEKYRQRRDQHSNTCFSDKDAELPRP